MPNTDIECSVECERLVIASYSLMDHGKYPETVALFASDGVWVRGGKPFTGQDAILASLNERSPEDISRHLVTNVVVTQSGPDEAEATALFVPLRGRRNAEGAIPLSPPAMIGDLFYRFRRENDAWRISELRPSPLFKA